VAHFVSGIHSFTTWTADNVAAYCKAHPIGTTARLALVLVASTALRRSDIHRLGPQHLFDHEGAAWYRITTGKTGIVVEPPMPAVLLDTIAASVTGLTSFLFTSHGKPYTAAGLGNAFREWCVTAKLEGIAKHGIRKLAATDAGDAGATELELMALLGHASPRESAVYTRAKNRRLLAASVAGKVSTPIK
jgi:integrase